MLPVASRRDRNRKRFQGPPAEPALRSQAAWRATTSNRLHEQTPRRVRHLRDVPGEGRCPAAPENARWVTLAMGLGHAAHWVGLSQFEQRRMDSGNFIQGQGLHRAASKQDAQHEPRVGDLL